MAHKHSVRDTGAHFLIDQFTRQIKNDSANKTTIVQYDHNSERLTFEIPLYVDGHAMTLCDLIEIHYINISTDGNSQNPGTYEVNDIKAEGENAVFTWLISQECTQLAGSLNFFIVFKCTENGVTVYRWGTEIFKNLPISAGMDNGEAVLTEYPDILAQWKAQLFDASDTAVLNVATAEANALAAIEAAGEAKKQSVLDSIPDEYEEVTANVSANAAKINELANAIKGKLSGAVVRADDVSPVEHNPFVKVHGKNLLDTSKIEVSDTAHEEYPYFTEVGEGYVDITVGETYNGNGHIALPITLKELCPQMVAGKTYFLSANSDAWNKCLYLKQLDYFWNFGNALKITDEMLECTLGLYGYATYRGQNPGVCRISNLQIEEGETATEYTPYIDPETVKIRRCGKNLVDVSGEAFKQYKYHAFENALPSGTYTVSAIVTTDDADSETSLMSFALSDGNKLSFYFDRGEKNKNTFTAPAQIIGVHLYAATTYTDSSEDNASWGAFQLEQGETATDYEPYNGATYTPAADGVVSGVTSLSPCMTILTDTEGVTVECEYNRDTNKVIADILDRIEALKNA